MRRASICLAVLGLIVLGLPAVALAEPEAKISKFTAKSIASPIGSILGEVTFGTERVPEESELRAFFGEGGLLFYVAGHSPVSLEIVSKGKYKPSHQPPYGEELETLAPAVATVPGAP